MIEMGKRLWVEGVWANAGVQDGIEVAKVDLQDRDDFDALQCSYCDDELESAAEVANENRRQGPGDISQFTRSPNGPSRAMVEEYERGFKAGFKQEVKRYFDGHGADCSCL